MLWKLKENVLLLFKLQWLFLHVCGVRRNKIGSAQLQFQYFARTMTIKLQYLNHNIFLNRQTKLFLRRKAIIKSRMIQTQGFIEQNPQSVLQDDLLFEYFKLKC
ncbi:unnamed protein product [Paramecium octaurelia]|uniref:Secreted protein n=1 Tax=Paramecium octaurelia TaxID=43137 RepID=A0A8S1X2H0_PAROT|nr:unnamed protein product [Paramecium octaurelia]